MTAFFVLCWSGLFGRLGVSIPPLPYLSGDLLRVLSRQAIIIRGALIEVLLFINVRQPLSIGCVVGL
jgi:hypothetical protein